MHTPPEIQLFDAIPPALAAVVFVLLMSLVREPTRRTFNAIVVTGASGVYMSGGFGLWEVAYAFAGCSLGFLALGSYRWIGIGWLMHAAWDVLHHLYGNPIWPFMATSSFGCMVFDSVIATWFLAGAPSLVGHSRAASVRAQ
jgi:uncharacterized protein DUF6010